MDVFESSWVLFLAILSMALIVIIPMFVRDVLSWDTPKKESQKAIQSHNYRGEAQIISIDPLPQDPGSFEIKFVFQPQENLQEEIFDQDRKWTFLQKNSTHPQENFLNRHDIQIGKCLPCTMKIFRQNTQTSVSFDFPTIPDGTGR
jgi:hypothetical protein